MIYDKITSRILINSTYTFDGRINLTNSNLLPVYELLFNSLSQILLNNLMTIFKNHYIHQLKTNCKCIKIHIMFNFTCTLLL